MHLEISNAHSVDGYIAQITVICPHCGHLGTFNSFGNDLASGGTHIYGIRICPNYECLGFLFFIYDRGKDNIIATFPPRVIPIDSNNIPENVLAAFQEAVSCHSNGCFIAAGIMIRKTLEELCADKLANGKNLKEKLIQLGSKIVVPNEMMEGMNELRLLGNDAAHIESSTFNSIGKEEIEVSIEFTKEILKAVYQYESLLGKIRNLKKP